MEYMRLILECIGELVISGEYLEVVWRRAVDCTKDVTITYEVLFILGSDGGLDLVEVFPEDQSAEAFAFAMGFAGVDAPADIMATPSYRRGVEWTP